MIIKMTITFDYNPETNEYKPIKQEVVKETPDLNVASVRATLTSLATKGLLSKEKDIYEGKEKTKYSVIAQND